jgi:NAD-dependent dihydropyrimidine dehydrogenase PreA subunit
MYMLCWESICLICSSTALQAMCNHCSGCHFPYLVSCNIIGAVCPDKSAVVTKASTNIQIWVSVAQDFFFWDIHNFTIEQRFSNCWECPPRGTVVPLGGGGSWLYDGHIYFEQNMGARKKNIYFIGPLLGSNILLSLSTGSGSKL